ncbi:MAG: pantoate--beta-alanine ligase [Woeseiaceae bacterium]|nr:pantoate--beta-alanine ligase [Woeseiaceae bacterium]
MQAITNKDELRELVAGWRANGEHVALVPTMGNLHPGHVSLVEFARRHAERIVVTVYVNPTQFGEDEDFDEYPRTLDKDTLRLKQVKADVLFVPDDATVYPFGHDCATIVSVPGLTENFCGASRPGHFDGVTTVVARLFALVQPDVAIFGQKDYQQQLVIRYMTEDLTLPIRIVMAPTVRDKDGLAMSSRNQYLSDEQRKTAPLLFATLSDIGERLEGGESDYAALEKEATQTLSKAGFEVDYVAIRRSEDLAQPDREFDELVVLAAAQLGKARLIDNILVTVAAG